MTRPLSRLASFCCLLLLLAGCGLKGELYIPEKEPAAAQTPAPAAPGTAENAGDENDEGNGGD